MISLNVSVVLNIPRLVDRITTFEGKRTLWRHRGRWKDTI